MSMDADDTLARPDAGASPGPFDGSRAGDTATPAAGPALTGSDGGGPGSQVGLVLGTEPAAPLVWWVAIGGESYLQLDDVVSVTTRVPGAPDDRREVVLSGVVSQVLARHEGARFENDVFLAGSGMFPIELARSAKITTTRMHHPHAGPNAPVLTVPPIPGSPVMRATAAEREAALHFDEMQEGRLPAGFGRDDEPIYIDASFVDGRRGGHINISGISGVATKTSYALFLVYGLLNSGAGAGHEPALEHPKNARVLVFNVKGQDLLYLDQPNRKHDLAEDPEADERYRRLGLVGDEQATPPFRSVEIWGPLARGSSATTTEEGAGNPYYWTVRDFVEERLLRFCFLEAGDERSQIADLVARVEEKLVREGEPILLGQSPNQTEHPEGLRYHVPPTEKQVEDGADPHGTVPRDVTSFDQLIELIEERVHDEDRQRGWKGAMAGGTVEGFIRRLRSASQYMGHLVRGQGENPNPYKHRVDASLLADTGSNMAVVDISRLHDRAKRFVVGAVMKSVVDAKERGGGGSKAPLLIVLDELNKYAPREGSSPIKEVLLDISERGRSMGLILVGAQQTASEVSRRVVSNASIRVVGRMDSAEVQRSEYAYMDSTAKQRALLLSPGAMLLLQPRVPVPIEVTFPFPAWATRKSEVRSDTARAEHLIAGIGADDED